MSCDPLHITAYVDGVVPPEARAEVESHLASCPACREQEAFERGLRERLRAAPSPELPAGLEGRLRRRLRRRPMPAAVEAFRRALSVTRADGARPDGPANSGDPLTPLSRPGRWLTLLAGL